MLAVAGIVLVAGGATAYLWDSSRADRIAEGVTVAGVDVGGLRAPEATTRVQASLSTRLRRSIEVVSGEHRFRVRPTGAGLHVDVAHMVDEAVQASRSGGLAHRVLRDLRGKRVDVAIPLRAALSQQHVDDFVARVARVVDRPARSARVVPTPLATGLKVMPSKAGLAVKQPQLAHAITNALLRLEAATSTIDVPTRAVAPRWWTSTIKRRYGTYILVSRETYTLRLYKQLKLAKTYRIAVGRAGLETPAGEYTINDKQVDPSWHVPLSSWAGDLAGRVIPPGPDDPIKARWMGFYDGAGIHGTDETWSIGSAASHGCIRMMIPDVEQLYDLVPLHTPIYVG